MAFAPIAFVIPEYDRNLYKNWWMKAYEPGTTTPKAMATDQTGSSTASRYELNTEGFPITAGSAFVVPHVDGDYDLWLFPTAAEADTNDTTNALQFADNLGIESLIKKASSESTQSSSEVVLSADTVADMKTKDLQSGQTISTKGYYAEGDGGGASYLIQTSAEFGGTPDGFGDHTLVNGNVAVLQVNEGTTILQYGAKGAPNESANANAMLDSINRIIVPKDLQIFVSEIELGDDSYVRNQGKISLVANSAEWSRIFTNKDRVNGNKNIVIDNTDGEIDGNYPNQGVLVQHSLYFVDCQDTVIFGGKLGRNRAEDEGVYTPSNHPEGPFTQGVPYGENQSTNPTIGCVVFMGGINNTVRDYTMRDWQQEGVTLRWNEGGLIDNFKAINGPETDNIYYSNVDFGSRDTAANLVVGSHVLVQDGHTFGGTEQQPDLIYSSLVSGVTDLTLEDFTDTGRWTLVERDITNDLGYTAARTSGAKGQINIISNGYAAFCRASSFSQDSEFSGMSNLHSYHNAFFNGINWGHEGTPASRGYGNGLVAINSGWKGSAGGLDFGIGLVSESSDVTLSDFHITGSKAKGLNISGNADEIKITNGTIKWSGEEGLLNFNSKTQVTNVTSKFNAGSDFLVTGTGNLSLHNCKDSTGRTINTDELFVDFTDQSVRCLTSNQGARKDGYLSNFSKPAGQPLARVFFDGASSADNGIIEIEYLERNSGSGAIGNQYAAKETWLFSGTGGNRNVARLDSPYQQGRQFNVVWSVDTLQVFLQDNVPADTAAGANQNSIKVSVSSQVTTGGFQIRLG